MRLEAIWDQLQRKFGGLDEELFFYMNITFRQVSTVRHSAWTESFSLTDGSNKHIVRHRLAAVSATVTVVSLSAKQVDAGSGSSRSSRSSRASKSSRSSTRSAGSSLLCTVLELKPDQEDKSDSLNMQGAIVITGPESRTS